MVYRAKTKHELGRSDCYSRKEAAEILGISVEAFKRWDLGGLAPRPKGQELRQKGRRLWYSMNDILAAGAVGYVTRQSFSVTEAQNIRDLIQIGDRRLLEILFVVRYVWDGQGTPGVPDPNGKPRVDILSEAGIEQLRKTREVEVIRCVRDWVEQMEEEIRVNGRILTQDPALQ